MFNYVLAVGAKLYWVKQKNFYLIQFNKQQDMTTMY